MLSPGRGGGEADVDTEVQTCQQPPEMGEARGRFSLEPPEGVLAL